MTDRELTMALLWEDVLRIDRDILVELAHCGRVQECGWLAWAIAKRGRLAAEWHTLNAATGAVVR